MKRLSKSESGTFISCVITSLFRNLHVFVHNVDNDGAEIKTNKLQACSNVDKSK